MIRLTLSSLISDIRITGFHLRYTVKVNKPALHTRFSERQSKCAPFLVSLSFNTINYVGITVLRPTVKIYSFYLFTTKKTSNQGKKSSILFELCYK